MKRISYWALSTLSALVLLFAYHTSTSGVVATAVGSTSGKSYSASVTTTSGGSGGGTATKSSASTKKSSATKAAAKRTVTGDVAQTQWGPVQVQLVLSGGTISHVLVLQYPNGNGRDAEINSYALPILTQETISAQSASIDMVSGATFTSNGYLQSLQSALDQAGL
jgi:uncharacterized protein with FMN-binding domain